MIVADTNVLSEPLRKVPDQGAIEWLAAHRKQIAITTISVGELLYGVDRLPHGRRRRRLTTAIESLVTSARSRLLDYDEVAARECARLRAERERAGQTKRIEDVMIAAIAASNKMSVATRNVSDFEEFGLNVIDPWNHSGRSDQITP